MPLPIEPIRGEYLSPESLAIEGKHLARASAVELPVYAPFDFPDRLNRNEASVLATYRAVARASEVGEQITPAAVWLLENHHIIADNFRQVRRDLPPKFYRQVPTSPVLGGGEIPRSVALAWLAIAHTDSEFSVGALTTIVDGFQQARNLSIGEVWAIPACLRLVLLENLRRLADRVDQASKMRSLANLFADELLQRDEASDDPSLLRSRVAATADDSFAAQLLYRLRDGSRSAAEALDWLERQLEARGTNAEDVIVAEHTRQSTGDLTVGNIIRSLRKIDDVDWTSWFEAVSKVDCVLRESSDYADLDPRSRNVLRDSIEAIARRSTAEETDVAKQALSFAAAGGRPDLPPATGRELNVGYYLAGPGRRVLERKVGYRPTLRQRFGRAFRKLGWLGLAGPIGVATGLILWFAADYLAGTGLSSWVSFALVGLFALPASEAASGIVHRLVAALARPDHLLGYELRTGIPDHARTLVVIPCIIADRDTIDDLARTLEVHYLSNSTGEIDFALLSDWADSGNEESPADRELLAHAHSAIGQLAEKYAHTGRRRFFLLHRRRLYSEGEGRWMGWERKRGKLAEFNLLLRGDHDTTFLPVNPPLPGRIRYVLTLDADTRLPRDAAAKLVGKLLHPLNAPQVDPKTGCVVQGHAILQPRVTPSLTTGREASLFQLAFSFDRGLDPYVFTVSDIYQDLFDEGSFTGKGLYDVDAFRSALAGRIEEDTVLSHDLLEGAFARSALVTDVVLVEDFPVRYDVEASRQHRWVRGDWQLLPFIFGRGNDVPALSRFKMFDNLRRSLVPIAWLLASIAGWATLPAALGAGWQALLVISLFVAPLLGLMNDIVPRQVGVTPLSHLHSLALSAFWATTQTCLRIVLMAHTAWANADAIVRALWRMAASRRKMLEWRTAAAQSAAAGALPSFLFRMWASPAVALVAAGVLAWSGNAGGAVIAVPFLLAWLIAPAVAWAVSRSSETEDQLDVSEADTRTLRTIARRTWRYFERFVLEEHNFLPPDNYQAVPEAVVAARTSPTNIGLYLLSVVTARDLGWIGFTETLERLEKTLATLERMEKLHGHLFNWYGTRDLRPLDPRYISSVDSGNLAGHLVAVASACRQWAEAPAVHLLGDMEGIRDTAAIVGEHFRTLHDERRSLRPLKQRFTDRQQAFLTALDSILSEPEWASIKTINLSVLAGEIVHLARALHYEMGGPETRALIDWSEALQQCCEAHIRDAVFDRDSLKDLRKRLEVAGERARKIAFSMDFHFLYNPDRHLFSIGYRVTNAELDESCYDLLASEARLTSLFAIAKGDVASKHWFRLGRPIVPIGRRGALASWSGSMFEYLMPPLVMYERRGGILNQTNQLAVGRHIAYGAELGIPWGISESAFNVRDSELTYQYSNFGVPSLGLKRDLARNAVVAPYATALASQYRPRDAVRNFGRLRALGAMGEYGFHDAIDFTPSRLPEGQTCAIVYNFMAHHQGMTIAAIGNVVMHGAMRERFHADPVIEAAELLLQEKAPSAVVAVTDEDGKRHWSGKRAELARAEFLEIRDPSTADRATCLLSNGHYSIMLTATGEGYARWNGLSVTRWRPSLSDRHWGGFVFVRDLETGEWWSATAAPKAARGEVSRAVFADEKVEFYKTVGTLETMLECIVATDADAEGRQLTVTNRGETDRFLDVTSYSEAVLASDDSDRAHPVFSKMFVRTEIGEGGDVIFAERNKRSPGEPDICVAHLVVDPSRAARATEAETDRRTFIGRGRSLANAAAFDPGATLGGGEGFTLDPIFALRRTLRVPAGKKVRVTFWTIAAPSRAEAETAVRLFRRPESYGHESRLAWTRSQVQMRHVGITSQEAATFQQVARFLIYPDPLLRAPDEMVRQGLRPQSSLWPLGISGDVPIFVLRIDNDVDLAIVAKALRMQEFFRGRGFVADLVIVNERAASYAQTLQESIVMLCDNVRLRGPAAGPAPHIFSVRRDLMDEATYLSLIAAARVVLHTRNGKISEQLARHSPDAGVEPGDDATSREIAALAASGHRPPTAIVEPVGGDLLFWNGYGGFDPVTSDYIIRLLAERPTPQPWINVLANAEFGVHVSADGTSFTWSANSRDHQLTPWSNDPVSNRAGEAVWISDTESGEIVSPLACLGGAPDQVFETRHGPGFSRLASAAAGLDMALTHIVAEADPLKLSRLEITNERGVSRHLRIHVYAEWVLGNDRVKTAPFIQTEFDAATSSLRATNPLSIDFAGRTAFLAASEPVAGWTASRGKFLGTGTLERPAAVVSGLAASEAAEESGDPCAALEIELHLEPGECRSVVFLMGDAASASDAALLLARGRALDFDAELARTRARWAEFLGRVQVETPDVGLNILVNTWLPYQAYACRMLARGGFYQVSGAFGFRDQLQDAAGLLLHDPALARTQILNAAAQQFEEGDVQHWWLPARGAGVRTLISDDIVWLAHCTRHYVQVTGDETILDEQLSFIAGPQLEAGQHDAYFTPERTERTASLYDHCALALDLAVERTGEHGLPLILGGDWNDGMNRVGAQGRGESVWLGWFLADALGGFVPLARSRGDEAHASRWETHRKALAKALDGAGWDGAWYRRGFYDDGTPLGSATNSECRIDSIAQSWAVLSGEGDATRRSQAIDSALRELHDADAGLVRLFTPPFETIAADPGYIKSYPPGVRENGGQYTHAGTWMVCALAELGRGDDALACFQALSPIAHSSTKEAADLYRVEPYVVAADIYGVGDKRGRGGWTWYTGSAAWLWRAAVEGLLGITRQGDSLVVRPALPSAWDGFSATIRLGDRDSRIEVRRGADGQNAQVVQVNERRFTPPDRSVRSKTPDRSKPTVEPR